MEMYCYVKTMCYRDINFRKALPNSIFVGFLDLQFEFLYPHTFKYMPKWRSIPLRNFGHSKVPKSDSLEKYDLQIPL